MAAGPVFCGPREVRDRPNWLEPLFPSDYYIGPFDHPVSLRIGLQEASFIKRPLFHLLQCLA